MVLLLPSDMDFMLSGMPEERLSPTGEVSGVPLMGEMETASAMSAAAAGMARSVALSLRFPLGGMVSSLIIRMTSASRVAGGVGAGSSAVSRDMSVDIRKALLHELQPRR